MWFAFGLITLAGVFILNYKHRAQANWKGSLRQADKLPQFEYLEVTAKDRIQGVRVGISAPHGFQFRIRKETYYDRFSKWIGLSVELQSDDPNFDETIYLESDVQCVGELLSEQQNLRSAILNLFVHADASKLTRVSVRCAFGRIWLQYVPPRDKTILVQIPTIVRYLHTLSQGLANSLTVQEQRHDPFVRRAIVLVSISTATLALGIYGVFRTTAGRTDILDLEQLFLVCLPVGLLAIAFFVFVTIAALGRTSRTHLVLLEGILIGGFGFILSTFALAREFNIEFDTANVSAYTLHDVQTEQVVTRKRRRHYDYYLHTIDWRERNHGAPLRLEISKSTYESLQGVSNATIHTRPGALGFEWVSSIEPKRL